SANNPRLITEDGELHYIIAYPNETETGQAISISESEIANLIKSKGAVFAAIKSLVDYVGLSFDQLDTIYVAGGFGSSLNIPKAIAIGLIPDIDTRRIQFIGNSSLTGARMSLTSTSAFEKSLKIARRMTNIELSNYAPFMNEFIAALFLPHTDAKLFPSVNYTS
ncbi:MAG: ASKHA domain-containing protein, partial [Dehalococcoidales bacterium]|nr:ASKHA domain-containing protein [Dehalococcoidales bacterium]